MTTLTCKVGKFIFHDEVRLNTAKLIRDSVMGQMLNPKEGYPRLRSERDCIEYARQSFKNEGPYLAAVVLT